MLLSVAICVYNTDRAHFEECLKSIRAQSLDGIQICVLDDGSDIDYSDLAERYGLKYKKTENRGIFEARCAAAELADGDFIAYVDSDDTLSFNYYLPMLREALLRGSDIVINDWAFHTERSRYCSRADLTLKNNLSAEGEDVLKLLTASGGKYHSLFVLWNKIYKRELLIKALSLAKEHSEGTPNFNYSEDALINFFAYKCAKKLTNVHTGYYFYRIHGAQTVNVVSEEKLRHQMHCMAHTLEIMLKNSPSDTVREGVRRWQELMSRHFYSHASANGYKSVYPEIKEAFSVDRLKRSTIRDGAAYNSNLPLPENFDERESALRALCLTGGTREVSVSKKDTYALATLEHFINAGEDIVITPTAELKIPTPKV
ncbi:MAG: glycosyltransferase family 2 protein, partial [Clostridia bacterium]|nr:glycosyltransferase family 2 protein [Clostridia bacterium]